MDRVHLDRFFWPPAAALLAVMGTVQVTSILQETQTWDEGIHLAAGYSYLQTGDYRMNPQHPPLGKILAALPLLPLRPRLELRGEVWEWAEEIEFGTAFLYQNRVPADRLLFLGRTVTIALTLLLGLSIAAWTRRRFGAAVALFALFLFALDPNFVAHGRYITSDVIVTLFILLTCLAWGAFLESGTWWRLTLAGIALGLALASKFSALFLFPLLLLFYLIRWWQQGPGSPLSARHLVVSMSIVTTLAVLLVVAAYPGATTRIFQNPTKLVQVIDPSEPGIKSLYWVAGIFHLPAHPWLVGLFKTLQFQNRHEAYLLGRRSILGWWYYFPIAFAVKTPLATLALSLAGLAAALLALLRNPRRVLVGLRRAPFVWYLLTVPMGLYLLLSMRSSINIGLRHLLPIYPFLFILLAAVLFRSPFRRAWPLLVLVQVFEFAAIYPHYLAFFNLAAGGPGNGPRYLLDSNIDWGQDVRKLKQYMDSHGIADVCVSYFGKADLSYYGVRNRYLPHTDETQQRAALDCVAAISVTPLYDVYVKEGSFQWLRELEPFAKIGYSIYLYDLRKDPRVALSGNFEGITAASVSKGPAMTGGSIVPQIVSGGGFETEFAVTNPTAAPARADIRFFDDRGRMLLLMPVAAVRGARPGPFVGITGTIPAGATHFAALYPELPQRSGYARVFSTPPGAVSVTTLLHRKIPTGTDSLAAVPTGSRLRNGDLLPFTGTGGFATTLVLVNDSTAPEQVRILARDEQGRELCRGEVSLAPAGRAVFNLADRLRCAAGRAGQIEFQTADPEGVAGLGLLFHDAGSFTPLLPAR